MEAHAWYFSTDAGGTSIITYKDVPRALWRMDLLVMLFLHHTPGQAVDREQLDLSLTVLIRPTARCRIVGICVCCQSTNMLYLKV